MAVSMGIVSLLAGVVGNARADDRVIAASYYAGLAAADLASTEYALNRGAVEANAVMRGEFGKRLAIKAASVGALTWIDYELGKRDRTIQWIVRGLAFAVNGYLVWNNVRQGRR
jgi:hypothetical protein